MERYEYRLVKTPSKSTRYKGLSRTGDAFAQTLMDAMNELAIDGWQFMRTEVMTERRRSLLGVRSAQDHEYMLYRRPLRSDGMGLNDTVSPRRIRRSKTPDAEQLRERVVLAIQEPAVAAALAR